MTQFLWYNRGIEQPPRGSNHRGLRQGLNPMPTPDHTPSKRCTKCGDEYPATAEYFHADRSKLSGIRSSCKWCSTADALAYRRSHLEKRTEAERRYKRANRDKCNALLRAWRKKNPDKVNSESTRASKRAWKKRNADKVQQDRREFMRTHPEKVAEYNRNRRARRLNSEGAHTDKDVQLIFKHQHGKCYYCKCELGLYHVDHVIPLSRGGSNGPENIVLACAHCNSTKNNKMPHEWPEGGRLL